MSQKKKKLSPFFIFVEIILFAYMISLIFPFLWLFVNSLKTPQEFFENIWNIPQKPQFVNYYNAFIESKMARYFLNTLLITGAATFITIMFSSMVAYTLAKYKFPGRNFVYALAIMGFFLPQVGTLGPFYVFMKNAHLFNPAGLLISYASGLGFGMIILYSFFKKIPWDYAEVAFLDGASHFKVFYKLMIPLAKNGIIPLIVFNSITYWNDYFIPSILITNKEWYTVAVGLQRLQVQLQYSGAWTVSFAAVILTSIPMVLLYIFLKQRIVEGFTMGGIKG